MKKTSLVLLSMMLAGVASAKDAPSYSKNLYSAETHPMTPLAISLADPVQLPPSNFNVYGLRWDIFYGNNFEVYGIDLGLVGHANDSFAGLSLTAANWIENDMNGVEFGAIANVVRGNAAGGQLAAFVNYDHGAFTGFQTALVNYDGAFGGVQFGGLNWVKGQCYGLQLGVGNVAISDFRGWSVGIMNYTERMSGLQLGFLNVAGETGEGLQIGCFNAAPKFSGLQIGLLNIIGNAPMPTLPVVNGNF